VQTLAAARLETVRLEMCRPVRGDIGAIYAIHSDPRTVAHNPLDATATPAEAALRFEHWDEHWRRYRFGYWAVRFHGDPAVLGFCGLKVMQFQGSTVLNLFYRLAPEAWGDGIATEAARAAVDWAAERVPGCMVIARVRPENHASARVAARTGLVRSEDLDGDGYDGFETIWISPWP
jgi:[ribosomal protein S5]-alanine N-acetyltransferase